MKYRVLRKAGRSTAPIGALDLGDDILRLKLIIRLLDDLVNVDSRELLTRCKGFKRELETRLRKEFLTPE